MTLGPQALVIGAGPAGLMAAEHLALAGCRVTLVDRMPSVGRKFLMAGKSGLNLTKDAPVDDFLATYGAGAAPLVPLIHAFGPREVVRWAEELGQDVFRGSTGRIFPRAMKASPLLRAWLNRLDGMGVVRRVRWTWTAWNDGFRFDTSDGPHVLTPDVTVLALGGGSWPRLGSNAAWIPLLRQKGVDVVDFRPSNAGLRVPWSAHMTRHFGAAVKGVALITAGARQRGEFVITANGLEGGGIYAVSRAVREGAELVLDLRPDWNTERIASGLQGAKGSISNRLRKGARLDPAQIALLMEFGRPLPEAIALARLIKALPTRHNGLAPLDEAISSAGGVAWGAVDQDLMLRSHPGLFVAGEMLDWDAPTGGYLLTACFATGRQAGRGAARYALRQAGALPEGPGSRE